MNVRALAAKTIYEVLEKGISLSVALPDQQQHLDNGKDKALLAELCYGVMRQLPQLDKCVSDCLAKPFKGKQRILHQLLIVGCYQLYFTRIPAHAAISETAEACRQLRFDGLVKVVNGVLRTIQRQDAELNTDSDTLRFNTPAWFIKRLQQAYPDKWQHIIEQSHQRPPMWLRNNQQLQTRDTYLAALAQYDIPAQAGPSQDAILLDAAKDVAALPDFMEGAASVQDGAAQWAATLLAPKADELVLDACAAPGGKSCHLLELAPNINLVAVDFDQKRLARVQQNLDRLHLKAQLIHGDAADIPSWWQGQQFDRILLDAPCSATGVIRRHPDIKWLRKNSDIEELANLQKQILDHCWQWLKPGGTLLYATCSILPQENSQQVEQFLERTADASLIPIEQQTQLDDIGWQILPGQDNMDGFYYARLVKAI
ncbi:16S rRNA (cytosine(967)-C(5))-methyltransferase RsmB [Shewanella sp. SR43-4]|jgi:16S rRNA (cytosine967-C5)-methyltransferase|uniref:16S rRNA (cytosine(967)-C(5))-methyltransferase RsmB n=1 Tax=Shewanella TaxID=22 RepID=UPI000F50F333|nr:MULTISPECIES: 16S rRNA (cytosine(967)-C(5))-methyltransferase RsmB [Shewanella]MBB1319460.1 16S rRNA (cytosine(967)-C(5))-methyltransferase RsmB [Shewanella sp. SR43-4]MBB1323491.1 16S rRNA (cytosine(967)-C(5))-methyltransferase RsmB [Shewanella sp. SR43-8]MBB1477699.1 16S rRNA (cytosine(967)-C(5))-methyltransferase RsmB [Shewanella sp. SG41-3]RPA50883.1 16S rRNA (cytosine(967)-C(5))-methyltransferase RsmB [Shewanella vesiculosa]UJL41954.1 16S rRNA (cytosine(967)-C(5))-methyltransferase Rsm